MPPKKVSPAKPKPSPTIYFAYGSNLWLTQMRARCPTSTYLGIARLPGYKWLINERGYANVVEAPSSPPSNPNPNPIPQPEAEHNDVVYGLVFTLLPTDEALLDKNEGVPTAYTKEYLPCDFWAAPSQSSSDAKIDTSLPPTAKDKEMLVYIDRRRVGESAPREEYVWRINRGVEDAVGRGVPGAYFESVVRRFVPAEGAAGERGDVEERARRQAGAFVDEGV